MKALGCIVLVALAAGACGPTIVDPDSDPDFAVGPEYQDWYRVDAIGEVPGHGDTYRIIYANDTARTYGTYIDDDLVYTYPLGSIIVKEVHERDGDGPGAIKYLGVMRKMRESQAPDGVELGLPSEVGTTGWLFTYLADDIDSDEEYRPACWDECHVAAPNAGAFLSYSE